MTLWSTCSLVLSERDSKLLGVSSSHRTQISSDQCLTLVTSFNSNYSSKGHISKCSFIGGYGFTIGIWGNIIQAVQSLKGEL